MTKRKRRQLLDGWRWQAAVGLGMVLGGEPELLFDRVAYLHGGQ